VEEELESVPRFKVQTLAYGFGDCGLSFTAERGFHERESSNPYILAKVKMIGLLNFLTSPTILGGRPPALIGAARKN
jgi:hypothetical protein